MSQEIRATRPQPDRIEFFFDYMCPWAYRTSVWIRQVRDAIGFSIDWRFFSLEEVNREEGKKHPWERDLLRYVHRGRGTGYPDEPYQRAMEWRDNGGQHVQRHP